MTTALESGFHKATISAIQSPDSVEVKWNALEERSNPPLFLTWTWIGPWLRLMLKHTQVYLFEYRVEDQVVALVFITRCPITRLKGRLRIMQVHLNECICDCNNMVIPYNGLLVREDSRGPAWHALIRALQDWDGDWDEIAFSSLSDADAASAVAASQGLSPHFEKTYSTWALEIGTDQPSLDDSVGRLKKKSRQQIRQSLKGFAQLGTLSLQGARDTEQALDYFEQLGRLHTARWEAVGKAGSFANPRWVEFHRDLIATSFSSGRVQLLMFTCDEDVIGYLYGHSDGDTVFMHQTGFAMVDDNRLRPGYVSHVEAMHYNAADGVACYDFLPDEAESYKRFFATVGAPIHWLQLRRPRRKFKIEALLRGLRNKASDRLGARGIFARDVS